jgi:hypothetical protein
MQGVWMVLSITRIPDHGVEFLGAKFWGGNGQADIFLAGGFVRLGRSGVKYYSPERFDKTPLNEDDESESEPDVDGN